MIRGAIEELFFAVDLDIVKGQPDALEGLIRNGSDLLDLAHQLFHLIAEPMGNGAEQFFHRIAEIPASLLFEIFADRIRMADQLQRHKGQIQLGLLHQIGCVGQVLLILHVRRFHVRAHLGIDVQVFQAAFKAFLIFEKLYIGFDRIADVILSAAQGSQLLFAAFELFVKCFLAGKQAGEIPGVTAIGFRSVHKTPHFPSVL